jgi:signal transduction histidine kinase
MKSTELILVVDDTSTNLKVISEVLSDAGFEVAIATDGERAIKQVQHIQPDLILLDVMMPGIDGFETCRRLKSSPSTQDIPVIFMTALSDVSDRVKGFSLGAVDYITKPFQEQEVLARVRLHLKVRNHNKELERLVAERTADLTDALEQLKQSQLQLVQQEKMSVLGGLVAGVAHEINNPIGFIAGNLKPASEYVQDLFHLIELYQQHYPDAVAEIQDEIDAIDLDYVREDLPKLLFSMKEGVNRICSISNSLRSFSRADSNHKVPFNVHEGIDSTISILGHRLKANEQRPAITVMKDYDDLPLIQCFPGQLNQVFMNLLANAIDALEEANQSKSYEEIQADPNWIRVKTCFDEENEQILIHFQDNGIGMPEIVKQQVFDYLFTTKPLGKGTGLGLSISHQIITKKHQGTLSVNSKLEQGAEFIITLPIN